MHLVINTNDYCGGGETFVERFLNNIPSSKCFISNHGYLRSVIATSKTIDLEELNLLSSNDTVLFLNFRDLFKYGLEIKKNGCTINYYCLHIYDPMYQSVNYPLSLYLSIKKKKFFKSYVKGLKYLLNILFANYLISGKTFFMNSFALEFHPLLGSIRKVLPLPVINELKQINKPKHTKFVVLWIGRYVDFKIPSIMSLIQVCNNLDLSLKLVGVTKEDIEHKELSSVEFLGTLNNEDLISQINLSNIGFGMGTSSVLMASHALPVVLAQPYYGKEKFTGCIGHFYNQAEGEFGEGSISGNVDGVDINECFTEIISNYKFYANKSLIKSKEFDVKNIFKLIE